MKEGERGIIKIESNEETNRKILRMKEKLKDIEKERKVKERNAERNRKIMRKRIRLKERNEERNRKILGKERKTGGNT
jgi:hypothetical protein